MKIVSFEFKIYGEVEAEDEANVDDLLVAFSGKLGEASYIDRNGDVYVTSTELITPELKGGQL